MTARVLITAGANGIGLVMARAFAAQGDRVWVTDVDAAMMAALPPGVRGHAVRCRIRGGDGVLFAEIATDWGGLDVAIANAGIKGPTAAIEEMPLEAGTSALASIWTARCLCAGAARLMKPAGKGVITFISSTSGFMARPSAPPMWPRNGV